MKRFIFLIVILLSIIAYTSSAQLQWREFGKLSVPRHYHCSLPISSTEILVIGGYSNSTGGVFSGIPTTSCEIINASTSTIQTASSMNFPRAEFVALLTPDSNIVVISGITQQGNTGALTRTCEFFNRTTRQWRTLGNLNIARRQHVAGFINDTEILVVGGRHQNLSTMADAEVFNIVTGISRNVANFPNPINAAVAEMSFDNKFLVLGGRSGGSNSYRTDTIYSYNQISNIWDLYSTLTESICAPYLLKLWDSRILITGGTRAEGPLNVSNNVLIQAGTAFGNLGAMPRERGWHQNVQWTNDSIIAIGGYDNNNGTAVSHDWINISTSSIQPGPLLIDGRKFFSSASLPIRDSFGALIEGRVFAISGMGSAARNLQTVEILVRAILQLPIAHFTIDTICERETIQYIDTSKNNPTLWKWKFSGGLPEEYIGKFPPPIRYNNAGSYTTTLIVSNPLGADTLNQTVLVRPRPIANAGPDVILCAKDSTQLGTTGSSNNTYRWSPTSGLDNSTIAQPRANPSASTQYYLTVRNEFGCESYDTVQVVRSPVVIANAGKDVTICPGNFVDIGSNPQNSNDKYSWSPSKGLNSTTFARPTANPLETTRYYLTVTNKYGCRSVDSVLVSVGEIVASVTSDTSVCHGSGVTLTASGGSEYEWSPSYGLSATTGASVTASPLETTVYQLIAKSGDCRDTAFLKVTVLDAPTADAGSDKEICARESVDLGGIAEAGLSYSWTPADGLLRTDVANPIATPLQTTEYVVEVTNSFGCVARDTVLVTVGEFLKVIASNDTSVCAGESVELWAVSDEPGVTYTWSPETGLDNPNTANPTATPTETTTYKVTAFKNSGLCTAVNSVKIEVLKLPEVTTKDVTLCEGDTAELEASSNEEIISWSWTPVTGLSNPNIQNPIITAFKSETYTVKATNKAGCEITKEINVTVTPKETITAVLKAEKAELEPGESTVLQFLLKAENSEGITSFKARINFDANVFQFTKNSQNFLNGADNTWVLQADIIAPGELEITANGQTPIASSELAFELTAYLAKQTSENILLKLTELNGEVLKEGEVCTAISEIPTTVVLKEVCAGDMRLVNVGEFQTALQQITPNPVTSEIIEIDYSVGLEGEIALEIYNTQGELLKTIFKGNHKAGVFKGTFSTEKFPAGVFLVMLSTLQVTETQMFTLVK